MALAASVGIWNACKKTKKNGLQISHDGQHERANEPHGADVERNASNARQKFDIFRGDGHWSP